MDVNEKGQIGLIKVMADLAEKGYECFVPLHDYSAVDLIVLNSEYIPRRLQVKYRTLINGKIQIPFSSVVNGKRIPINRSAIDGWAVYCPENNKIAYVDKNDISSVKGLVTLRIIPAIKKNQYNSSLLFDDFIDEKRLWKAGSAVNAASC